MTSITLDLLKYNETIKRMLASPSGDKDLITLWRKSGQPFRSRYLRGTTSSRKETIVKSVILYPHSPDLTPVPPEAIVAFESLHGEGSWRRTVLSIRACWIDAWTLATRAAKTDKPLS